MGFFKKIKRAIRKPIRKVKKEIKRNSTEKLIKMGGGPLYFMDKALQEVGIKASAVVNPMANLLGEAGEKFVDKPKAAAKADKEFQAMVADEQARQMKQFRRREAQAGAEQDASEELLRRRKRQDRRRSKVGGGSGRRGTILTGGSIATGSTLGSAGSSEMSGKKTKLGS